MSLCHLKVQSLRRILEIQNYLLKVNLIFFSDLLNKDPSKRMTIKEVLDHSWIQKFTKNKVADLRRITKNSNDSNFSIYTTINEDIKKENNI